MDWKSQVVTKFTYGTYAYAWGACKNSLKIMHWTSNLSQRIQIQSNFEKFALMVYYYQNREIVCFNLIPWF